MDARGKFGEHEGSVRVTPGATLASWVLSKLPKCTTSHLRWNRTMRHCFYHTDLERNVIFHNFATQILHSFNNQDDQSTPGLLAKPLKKKIQNHLRLLPNFIPRGGLAPRDFSRLFEKSSFKMADSQSKNSNESIIFRRNIDQHSLGELPKLSKERTQ